MSCFLHLAALCELLSLALLLYYTMFLFTELRQLRSPEEQVTWLMANLLLYN